MRLAERLANHYRQGDTGILRAKTEGTLREVFFVDGEIRAARSLAEDEMLGSWLVSRGLITAEQLASSLETQDGPRAPSLGNLLVRSHLVDQKHLDRELEMLAETVICRAAAVRCDSIDFRDDVRRRQPDTLQGLTTPAIILTAARATRDLSRDDLRLQGILKPGRETPAGTDLYLSTAEVLVLRWMDGNRTINDVLVHSGLDEELLLPAVFALKLLGFVITPSDLDGGGIEEPEIQAEYDPEQERRSIIEMSAKLTELNHYQILDLPEDTRNAQVYAAWQKLRHAFDPERVAEPHLMDLEPQLIALLARAEEAFKILSEPSKRSRYDQVIGIVRPELQPVGPLVNVDLEASGNDDLLPPMALLEDDDESQVDHEEERKHEKSEELVEEAKTALRGGDVFAAVKLLEQACDLGRNPIHYVRLARLMRRNPLWSNRVLARLKWALQLDPECLPAWLELADVWDSLSQRERQRKALERALQLDLSHKKANAAYLALVGAEDAEAFVARQRSLLDD